MAKPRKLEDKLLTVSGQYPVVAVTGPRQSGKSTLIQKVFPNKAYLNLEATRTLDFALSDPVAFLKQHPEGAIIDEIQKAPNLLSDIQVIVDKEKINGMFILSGSENLLLSESISQSLAGRIQILKLLPLSIEELPDFEYKLNSLDDLLYRGFYPRIYDENLNPTDVYGAYVETYLERDVRNILNIKDLNLFRRFLELAAGRTGQLLNKDNLANDTGVSPSTIEEWFSILEATFVCFRLQPWFSNIRKRLIKTPKLYFYDTGLVSYLLGIETPEQLKSHPLKGALLETMQITEVIKYLYNRNLRKKFYFFRDSHGNEVDLLIQNANAYLPLEIKTSQTFNSRFLKGINCFRKIHPEILHPGIILGGDESQKRTDFSILPWFEVASWLNDNLTRSGE